MRNRSGHSMRTDLDDVSWWRNVSTYSRHGTRTIMIKNMHSSTSLSLSLFPFLYHSASLFLILVAEQFGRTSYKATVATIPTDFLWFSTGVASLTDWSTGTVYAKLRGYSKFIISQYHAYIMLPVVFIKVFSLLSLDIFNAAH